MKRLLKALGQQGEVVVISRGRPCTCGPGFCASEAGVGFYGFCGGSRKEAAPDCLKCGAPHQAPEGCWACDGKDNDKTARLAVRALRLGVSWDTLFERQRRTGETLEEQITALEKKLN